MAASVEEDPPATKRGSPHFHWLPSVCRFTRILGLYDPDLLKDVNPLVAANPRKFKGSLEHTAWSLLGASLSANRPRSHAGRATRDRAGCAGGFRTEGFGVRRMPEERAGGKWALRYESALGRGGNLGVNKGRLLPCGRRSKKTLRGNGSGTECKARMRLKPESVAGIGRGDGSLKNKRTYDFS